MLTPISPLNILLLISVIVTLSMELGGRHLGFINWTIFTAILAILNVFETI